MAIVSYRDAGTRDIAENVPSKESRHVLPIKLHELARLKVVLLNAADKLDEVAQVPGLRLEKLKGKRSGQYSIRINRQYRICFYWTGCNAHSVEITDYH